MVGEDDDFPFDLTLEELAILEMSCDESIGIIDRISPTTRRIIKEPLVLTTKDAYVLGAMTAILLRERPRLDPMELVEPYRHALREMMAAGDRRLFDQERRIQTAFNQFANSIDHDTNLANQARQGANDAYQSLTDKGLIEDPVFLSIFGIPVVVLGLLPFSFAQRSRRGKVVYRRIQAAFWSYEMEMSGGERSTILHFELMRILKWLKEHMPAEAEDLLR